MDGLFSLKAIVHELVLYPQVFLSHRQSIANLQIVLKFDEFPVLTLDLNKTVHNKDE